MNETALLVQEYFLRKTLAKIGYQFDGSSLSANKAECFGIIANEFGEMELEEAKKAAKRRG